MLLWTLCSVTGGEGGGISPSNIIKEVLEEQLLSEGMTGYHCTLTCVQVYGKIVFPPNVTY